MRVLQPVYRVWPGLWKRQRDLRLEWRLRRWAWRDAPRLRSARQLYEEDYRRQRDPLVSVIISTYNRGRLLTERCVPSVLAQTYRNFEMVIVGDGCTDNTEERLRQLADQRIRFENLPRHSRMQEGYLGHCVVGSVPKNRALEMARGQWIALLDDDDLFTPDHIEALLDFALKGDYELVYARQLKQTRTGEWIEVGRDSFPKGRRPFARACIPLRTVMYRSYLRFFDFPTDSWVYSLGNDRILWERMGRAGVRAGFLDRVVAYKYLSEFHLSKLSLCGQPVPDAR